MRVIAIGTPRWTDHRTTVAALRRVMDVYHGPWTLVCDMGDGAARHAAAAARDLGWQVDVYPVDVAKCAADCPTAGHRRRGGPSGEFCPTAKRRNLLAMLDSGVDHAVAFVRPDRRETGERFGQEDLRKHDIGIWTYTQKERRDRGDAAE